MRRWMPALALLLALAGGGCTGGESSVGAGVPTPPAPLAGSSTPAAEPGVRVEVVAGGLEHVWDIGFLPDGTALVTERPGRIRLLSGTGPGAAVSEVAAGPRRRVRPWRGRPDGPARASRLRADPPLHDLPDPPGGWQT